MTCVQKPFGFVLFFSESELTAFRCYLLSLLSCLLSVHVWFHYWLCYIIHAFLCVFFFIGRFFEVLIGTRPEPLWRLLSKMGILYALEPLLTVIFVINMNIVWEKVMSTLRAQVFGRILIQKVKSSLYNFPPHF